MAGIGLALDGDADDAPVHVRQVDPAELSPGEFVHIVRDEVEGRGARLIVIDSLNGYLNAMPNERFLMSQLHEFLSYLAEQGVVTILVTAQHGLIGPMQAPVDASYLADTVVLTRFFEVNAAVKKAVSVIKHRRGAHEETIREFRIDSGGPRVGEALTGFHGVLTGTPSFTGVNADLMKEARKEAE